MIRRGFDRLDCLFDGTDTLVVEIATGKLLALDLGDDAQREAVRVGETGQDETRRGSLSMLHYLLLQMQKLQRI